MLPAGHPYETMCVQSTAFGKVRLGKLIGPPCDAGRPDDLRTTTEACTVWLADSPGDVYSDSSCSLLVALGGPKFSVLQPSATNPCEQDCNSEA